MTISDRIRESRERENKLGLRSATAQESIDVVQAWKDLLATWEPRFRDALEVAVNAMRASTKYEGGEKIWNEEFAKIERIMEGK